MYLAVFLLPLCLPAFSIIISVFYYLERRKPLLPAVLIGIAYGVMFYNYIPDSGNDSIRHMALLTNYKGIPIWQCFDAGYYSQMYVWDIWNWIVAQFSLPYLLQASGAFVGYTIISYIIFDYSTIINASKRTVFTITSLILMATSPVGYAIGIRSYCAYIVCVLGVYLSEIHKCAKIKVLFMMVLAMLLHRSAALLLLVWMMIPFLKKRPKVTAVISCFVFLGITGIIAYILPYMPGGWVISSIVQEAVNTIDVYQQTSNYNVLMSTSVKARTELGCSLLYVFSLLLRSNHVFPILEYADIKNSKEINSYGAQQMKNISVLYLIAAMGMLSVLTLNGSRYLRISELTVIIPLIYSIEMRPMFRKSGALQFASDLLIISMCALRLMLNVYSLAWGDASLISVVGGALAGVVYAIMS